MTTVVRTSPPSFPAVAPAQLREWLRLDPDVDQSTLDLLLGAAVDHITGLTGQMVVNAEYEFWLPAGVGTHILPVTNVSRIEVLSYYSADPALADDILDPLPPGLIDYGEAFRTITVLQPCLGPLQISVQAGWESEAQVPESLRHAIAIYVGAAYDSRHEITDATFQTIKRLCAPYVRVAL